MSLVCCIDRLNPQAIVAGVPVIASDIAGNIGLLDADYPGYYPVGDEQALAELLHRVETESDFLASLEKYGQRLAPLFSPAHEAWAWEKLVASLN